MKILVSAAEIQASVESLAAQIREREGNRPLTVIAIMTGSIVFLADLIRKLEMPLRVGVVQASSYRGTARGPLTINAGMMPDIAGRDVLLVDDIFDTGRTLQEVIASLADFRPRSLRSAVLLLKRGRQEVVAPVFESVRMLRPAITCSVPLVEDTVAPLLMFTSLFAPPARKSTNPAPLAVTF